MISSISLKSVKIRTNFLFGLGTHLGTNGLLILTLYYLVMQISAPEARELLGWIVPLAQTCCFFAALALAFGLVSRNAEFHESGSKSLRDWMIRTIMPFREPIRRTVRPAPKASTEPSPVEIETAWSLVKVMDWQAFKALAIAYYRELGFRVLDQPRRSEGIDFLAYTHTGYAVVGARCLADGSQCVSVEQVREFHRAIRLGGANHGVLVTPGAFDEDAIAFGEKNGLILLDGKTFVARMLSLPPESSDRLLGRRPR